MFSFGARKVGGNRRKQGKDYTEYQMQYAKLEAAGGGVWDLIIGQDSSLSLSSPGTVRLCWIYEAALQSDSSPGADRPAGTCKKSSPSCCPRLRCACTNMSGTDENKRKTSMRTRAARDFELETSMISRRFADRLLFATHLSHGRSKCNWRLRNLRDARCTT